MSEENSRLDRIERVLEKLVDNQVKLTDGQVKLTDGQVTLTEGLLKLIEGQTKLIEVQSKQAELHNKLELAQLETAEKLDALIKIADEWIRRQPPPNEVN